MSTVSSSSQSCALRGLGSTWVGVVLVSALLSAPAGCRSTTDNQIDLLERELRSQEDYIYELEDYVLEYSEKLRHYRHACQQQKKVLTETPEPALSNDRRQEKSQRQDAIEMPETESDSEFSESEEADPEPVQPESIVPEEIDIPDLELEISEPVGNFRNDDSIHQAAAGLEERELSVDEDKNLFIPDPVDFESSVETASLDDEPLDDEPLEMAHREAERLVIVQVLRDADGDSVPTSLLAVVEARDENNEPVDFDGEVSLMVMTADTASPRRLQRWDFTAEETYEAWQSSHLGDGLHLELPLKPLTLPETSLELWARLVTVDGRKLLTQLPFDAENLVALDEEAGGEKLPQQEKSLLAEDSKPSTPAANMQADSATSGWRPSSHRIDATAEGFGSTKSQPQRWTAQPKGGRTLRVPPVVATRPTTKPPSPSPATETDRYRKSQQDVLPANGVRPQWSPSR